MTADPASGKVRLRWVVLALALVLGGNALATPGFFHLSRVEGRWHGSLVDILNRGAPVLVVSVGMTLVIATGGIDLSVGAVMAIAGAVAARLAVADSSLALVVGAALLTAAALGLFNGLLVTALGIQPIVATLVLMVAGRGIAQILTQGQVLTFQHPGLAALGSDAVLGLPAAAVVAALWFLGMLALVRCSALGLFLEALGDNPRAARLTGLPTRALTLGVYAGCALGAGVAGLLATADIRGADANNVGMDIELDAILAVVLGGTALSGGRFALGGTVLGALLMQSVTTAVLTSGVPVALVRVVKALAVLGVCVLRAAPWHRLARREAR